MSPTETTSQEKAQEETEGRKDDLRLVLCDYVSDDSGVLLTAEEVIEKSPDAKGYTHYKLAVTPPKQPTSINKEEVDKDTLIAQQAARIKLLETSRIMIHTALQADADEQIKNHKQQLVNDAKKTLEKSKTPSINDGAKKNLAKTFKDSEAKGKKTRKPAAKKQKREPLIAPVDVAQDVPMTEIESNGKIQEAEVKKYEIEPRQDNPYCFSNDTITPKEQRTDGKDFSLDEVEDTIILITNHQKLVGKMGDFMMMLDSGVVLWATAAQAKSDCKQHKCEHLLTEYMNQYNVTYEMMGIVQKKRKKKDISISTNNDLPIVCVPCDSLHDKFICFEDETVATYANENQFYGGVMCRGGCGRHFCNKPTKLMVAGKRYNNISFDSVLFLL